VEIIKLDNQNKIQALAQAEATLRSGNIVIIPTDTVYGIIADASNKDTLKRIFELKKRPHEKAFSIFVKNITMARWYAYVSDAKARFLETIWPGPFIVVFHHKEKLPHILTGANETIGIRIPNFHFLLDLLDRFDGPLVQTSANVSDLPPAKNISEVESYFKDRLTDKDLLIDDGDLVGESSSVIDFTRQQPILLRTSLVSKDKLDTIFNSLQEFL